MGLSDNNWLVVCVLDAVLTLALRQEQGAWIYADGNGSAMPLAGASVA